MKKASKILLTISGVINIVGAIACIICGIVYAIMAFVAASYLPISDLQEAIQEMFASADMPEEVLRLVIAGVVALIYFLMFGAGFVLLLVCGIVNLKGAKAKKKGILIANIVFGVLEENLLAIAGAVLGLIGLSKEQNAEQANNVPEPEPVPVPAIEEKKEEPAKAEPVKEESKEEEQPAPAPARKDWFCPNCGAHNEGKFCAACGTKKPE